MIALRRLLALSLLLLAALTTLGGCGSSDAKVSPSTTYAAIIDVRTPAEFAQGHVAGARNIDVQSATFATDIAALPKTGTYLVYCRSGNRSAQAAATMKGVGLTVVDGGGLSDMESAGFKNGA